MTLNADSFWILHPLCILFASSFWYIIWYPKFGSHILLASWWASSTSLICIPHPLDDTLGLGASSASWNHIVTSRLHPVFIQHPWCIQNASTFWMQFWLRRWIKHDSFIYFPGELSPGMKLFQCILDNDRQELEQLLNSGANPNIKVVCMMDHDFLHS